MGSQLSRTSRYSKALERTYLNGGRRIWTDFRKVSRQRDTSVYHSKHELRLREELPGPPALRRSRGPFDVARARHGPDNEGPILRLGLDHPPGGALNGITRTYIRPVR